ncbi:N-acetyltransferase 6-like [Acanthaster planci]|uniref:N-acetyltransferase 6-like n=1 Tax=Acanthaster planci TaxID=133434 RepID=A0A8B7YHM7_ACAPL|nr:N-acetyltransferase 6-like [Acanthaster planci]
MALHLKPLHSNPDLIEDTIRLVKEAWPESLAERLRLLETSHCKGVPCSLALAESREGVAEEVLGHVRIVRVSPESENRFYLEAVTIKKSRRKEGLGKKLHELIADYAKKTFGARYIHVSVLTEDNERFYRRLNYNQYPVYAPQIAPNVLRTYRYARWDGAIIPEEVKYLYEDGEYRKPDEPGIQSIRRFVKDLDS